jgi:hypothetical protein
MVYYRYTLIINLARLLDWLEGTTYNHIISPLQPPLTVWQANLTLYPLVLDWTTENGPRTQLFDVCQVSGAEALYTYYVAIIESTSCCGWTGTERWFVCVCRIPGSFIILPWTRRAGPLPRESFTSSSRTLPTR